MRVTRAIREYVEDEINKKYDAAMDAISADYYTERQHVIDHIHEIMREASKVAEQYIKESGYEYSYGYRNESVFSFCGNIRKEEVDKVIFEQKEKLRKNKQNKIKQVLFDLEMGDTQKAELKAVLDNIVIE